MNAISIVVVVICLGISLGVGAFFSRRQTGTGAYFLADGRMSGWPIGFSITANMISAMTFLSNPGYSFQQDFRWVLPGFCFIFMAVFSMFFIAPYFRKVSLPSGYQYLEQRFGTWARAYAAIGYLLFQFLRLAIILYATSIALEIFLGVPACWIIFVMGVVVTIYTMMGGFEAVVWTEVFQVVILAVGAIVLVPAVLHFIPGGISTVFDMAVPAGKMSLGSMSFTFAEKTIWVMMLSSLMVNASDYTTRQDFIQRYRAPRSLGHTRLALAIGTFTVVPIWIYFNFLGTSLWTLYQVQPDPVVDAFRSVAPEKIVPYFMNTRLPPALGGLVLGGILMASLSTLAPLLNASAVTLVSDIYQRFMVKGRGDLHYLKAGRVTTACIGVLTIGLALYIAAARTQTLQDLHYTASVVMSAGLFGLFMLGFFSKRTGGKPAIIATSVTLAVTIVWLALRSAPAAARWPALAARVPDYFWIPVFTNLLLPAVALLVARALRGRAPPAAP